ncbi:MAG: DegT/DnrJ/EryC1/StrS family aminotransferase [Candidatus Omnitrophota bacterium]|nr:DegT/DnrJ/EryC1/StrS family aminotransferase [Candidatus Omnitrophota bacterium]
MILVNDLFLEGNEKKYLEQCINTGWISSEGPFVRRFEEEFASFVGVRHGIAVCNGTAALETALFALGVKNGDEVIMPSFTIISCAIACIRLGVKPVLVDIEPETWTMDVSQIEAKISPRTKVIMPVHIYGHPVNMDGIFSLSAKYHLKVLEDFAEAQGAEYHSEYSGGKWLKCGAMSDISATSFYANKIITTGEGGMVLTNNDESARRARSYRNLCFKEEKRFHHTELGYNFRMSNLQAAVGVAQLEQIERFIKIKVKLADYYRNKLSQIKGIRFMPAKPCAKSIYWVYAVELDPRLKVEAEVVMAKLKKHGVGTRPFFKGLHAQPALNDLSLFVNEKYPCTDFAADYGFYLPSGLKLTESQVDIVVDTLKKELAA